jgi:AraC-like DNA-binding protein
MLAASLPTLSPALTPFVSGLHLFEANDHAAPALERILPGGQVHLMVNLHEDEFRIYEGAGFATVRRSGGAVLEGPSSRARIIDTGLQRNLICVDFALGAGAAFFRVPLSEARDGLVELNHLWGRDGATLRERLLDTPGPEAKLRVLESVLLEHLVRPDVADRGLQRAAALLEQGTPVAEVSARIGILSKTLNRRFQSSLGLTPKRFARVRRLQRVLASIVNARDDGWVETALTHGYADQAHFVHDFRELTGLTPSTYEPRSPSEQNHVPVGPA